MAPEMAAGYVVGWIPSLSVTALQYWFYKKRIQSPAFQQLQQNLAQVETYWSETQARFVPLHEDSFKKDQDSFLRSLWIMGGIFFLMSWAGFIFNLIVLLSVRWMAVPRLERKVFASPLCERSLSHKEVSDELAELQQ